MRFLHRNHPPQPQETAAEKAQRLALEKAQHDEQKALENFNRNQKAHADAGRMALSLAERRARARDSFAGQITLQEKRRDVKAKQPVPKGWNERQHELELARQTTLAYGRQAAALLREHFKNTGDDPNYTFTVRNTTHYTAPGDHGTKKENVRGWLLFNEAAYQSIQNYPTGEIHLAKWHFLYHGPILLPTGEIRAFYDYEDNIGPGLQPPHRPLVNSQTNLRTTEYGLYRNFWAPNDAFEAEYETQQAIADLLEQHGVK